jgi:hypothetical protein
MKNIFLLFVLCTTLFSLSSCDTDFDVIADYKEVAIVYGLLNPNDSIHYLRINKAFLGPGNALEYAKVADSSSYGGNLDVYLLARNSSKQLVDSIAFDTITISNKEEGVFYAPSQLFYFAKAKLNAEYNYELKIKNRVTGYEASSITNLINNFIITLPYPNSKSISFKRSYTQNLSFRWQNAKNAKKYNFKFILNVKELGEGKDTTYRRLTWTFPEVYSETTTGSGESEIKYKNEEFYTFCQAEVPYSDPAKENAVTKRIASSCEFEITAINEEFSTFLDANLNGGATLEKSSYTNITNGYGILGSRSLYKLSPPIEISAETRFDLYNTMELKFIKPN